MPLEEVVHEIPNDPIRAAGTSVDDAAEEHLGGVDPLDSDRPLTIGESALEHGPSRIATTTATCGDLKMLVDELPILRDGVPKAGSLGANHLDGCFHIGWKLAR